MKIDNPVQKKETNSELSIGNYFLTYGGGFCAIILHLVVVHLYKNYRFDSDRLPVHRQFAAAILITQFFFLCMVLYSNNHDNEIQYVCYFMVVLLHYGVTSMFLWMMVEGINLAAKILILFDTHSLFTKYLALAWGSPLVIVVLSSALFGKGYRSTRICWVSKLVFVSSIIPTVSIVVLTNFCVIGYVLYIIKQSDPASRSLSTTKKFLYSAAFLLSALALTLVVTILGIAVDVSGIAFPYFTFAFFISCCFLVTLFYAFHSVIVTDGRLAFIHLLMFSLQTQGDVQSQPSTASSEKSAEEKEINVTSVAMVEHSNSLESISIH